VNDFIKLINVVLEPEITERVERDYLRREQFAEMSELEMKALVEGLNPLDDFHRRLFLEKLRRLQPQALYPKVAICRLYAEYNYNFGLELAEESLQYTDTSPYPYLLIGNHYSHEQPDFDRAWREYKKAYDVGVKNWLVYDRLGQYYTYLEKYDEMIANYEQAYKLNPDSTRTAFSLGMGYAYQRRWAEAARYCEESVQRLAGLRGGYDQMVPRAYRQASWFWKQAGEYEKAIELIEEGLRYDPRNEELLLSLGRYLTFNSDRIDDALVVTERLVNENPIGKFLQLRGATLYKAARYEDAIDVLQRSLRLDPYIEYTCTTLGQAYEGLNDIENAKKYYRRAIVDHPACWYTDVARERLAELERE